MAHQYHRETGHPERHHIIARQQSYHGNTLGALSAGGNAWRRATYETVMVPSTSHIAPCWDYRLRRDDETPEEYGRRAADLLETEILRIGPEKVSCFLAETVVGATLGCVPPMPSYFARIREICDRYGVVLILDEVMCGMGRKGTMHACEQEGISPIFWLSPKALVRGMCRSEQYCAASIYLTLFRKARVPSCMVTPSSGIRSLAPQHLPCSAQSEDASC